MHGIFRRIGAVTTIALFVTLSVATPAFADSGGGCRNDASHPQARVCISVHSGTTDPLWSDSYINSRPLGEYRILTYVDGYCPNTGPFAVYLGNWVISGGTHSPAYPFYKPCSSSGFAYTVTEYYNSSWAYLYTAFSPTQNW